MMNLEAKISSRLWSEVKSNYEARNYTGAILDSIYFLSDLIRQRTGLEADGVSLVGQAFGGKSPKLKVNKLQTESELNVQQGMEQLLRGIYQAFRNPRSHEKVLDTQQNADSIIVFIDYLLTIIDQSKTPFSKVDFLPRVFDSDFVESERYAALLTAEIPVKQRLEMFVEVFQKRETGECAKLKWFLHALYNSLLPEEQSQVLELISEELKIADADSRIRTTVQVVPPSCWPNLSEVARLRIENKFITSVEEGKYLPKSSKRVAGALGTWSSHLHEYFSLKDRMAQALARKLASENTAEQDYVFQYFPSGFQKLAPQPTKYLTHTIKEGLKRGDRRFSELVLFSFADSYEIAFEKEMKEFKEQPQAESEIEASPPEDDVPF
jgi:uncharacterized protein (TIGR02391 family)